MSQNFLHWPISIYSIIVVFLTNFFLTINHMLLLLTVTPHGLVNYDMQSCINNNNNAATCQSSCIDGGSLNVQFIAQLLLLPIHTTHDISQNNLSNNFLNYLDRGTTTTTITDDTGQSCVITNR